MWPLSEASAAQAHSIANYILIGGLLLSLLATIATTWTGRIKEEQLNRDLAAANERAATASADAARTRQEAARLQERAAFLEKEAAEARREQERLKGQLAWRRITIEQHDKLVAMLRVDPTDISVEFYADPETTIFANDIIRTLGDAGWKVKASATISAGGAPFGLIVPVNNAPPIPLIATALNSVGHKVTVETGRSPKGLQLIIGVKPAPF